MSIVVYMNMEMMNLMMMTMIMSTASSSTCGADAFSFPFRFPHVPHQCQPQWADHRANAAAPVRAPLSYLPPLCGQQTGMKQTHLIEAGAVLTLYAMQLAPVGPIRVVAHDEGERQQWGQH